MQNPECGSILGCEVVESSKDLPEVGDGMPSTRPQRGSDARPRVTPPIISYHKHTVHVLLSFKLVLQIFLTHILCSSCLGPLTSMEALL